MITQIRVENTNHCGYSCVFCPREELTRALGFMSVEDFRFVLHRIKDAYGDFDKSIHLHGFGEPLLDKNLPEKIRICKEALPKAKTFIVSTLGCKVEQHYLRDLVESGLDEITVSFYASSEEQYRKVTRTSMYQTALGNLLLLGAIRKELGRPAVRVVDDLEGVDDMGEFETRHSQEFLDFCKQNGFGLLELKVHNYGAGKNYNTPAGDSIVCSVVSGLRSQILQITWDLFVKPCAFDFNCQMPFGNLRAQTLDEIFASPAYTTFIESHLKGSLSQYPVCRNCDRKD